MISSQEAISLEEKYGAHNYHPLPVVISRGEGVHVWDAEGKQYYDFLSAYSAVNQGHCHPRIIRAFVKQAKRLTLVSRAFHSDRLGLAEEYLANYFGFEKVLMMNSGAEAVESAIKIVRKWGYEMKGVEPGKAKIIVCSENFHGRTTTIVSFSTDHGSRGGFGPFTPGFQVIPYSSIPAMELALEDPNVVGFLFEPIQGEAGVKVPVNGYLRAVREQCSRRNVLMMADEIQTGIGRTGRRLCCDHEGVKPDVLILGKALSGGTMPVSAVLTSRDVMEVLHPGQHGSTYGGNPLACAVMMEALQVIEDEKLAENAERLGHIFRAKLEELKHPMLDFVRGRGLLNAIGIQSIGGFKAWDVCMKMKELGLLAKPTHEHIIRFAPPLVITEAQIRECAEIIVSAIRSFEVGI
ncbi:MAG: ornithine--oxo-acid transaminase [Bacteroidota bacterium]|jgi:ornithine--oxo-acid transaminase